MTRSQFWSRAVAFRLSETWTGSEQVMVQLHNGHPGADGTANRVEESLPYVENDPRPVVWQAKNEWVTAPAVRRPWWAPWRWTPAHTVRVEGEICATHASIWLNGEPILLFDFRYPCTAIGGKFTIEMPPKLVKFDTADPTVT